MIKPTNEISRKIVNRKLIGRKLIAAQKEWEISIRIIDFDEFPQANGMCRKSHPPCENFFASI